MSENKLILDEAKLGEIAKKIIDAIPGNTSELNNDSDFATNNSVNEKIAAIPETKGPKGDKGEPGTNGKDGVSPTVEIQEDSKQHTISITDATGTKTTIIKDGKDGANGQDGAPGKNGADGQPGTNGKDGLTTSINLNSKKYTQVNGTITLPELAEKSEIQNLDHDKVSIHRYTSLTDKITQEVARDIISNYGNYEGKLIEFLTNGDMPNKTFAYGYVMSDAKGNQYLIEIKLDGTMRQWNKANYQDNYVKYEMNETRIDTDSLTIDHEGDSARYVAGLENAINKPSESGQYGAMMVLPYNYKNQLQLYIDITSGRMWTKKVTGTDSQHSFGTWQELGSSGGTVAPPSIKPVSPSESTLVLTTDMYQSATIPTGTTIKLPTVSSLTIIHLFFTTTDKPTFTLPSIKWQNKQTPTIDANKTYEMIFTYTTEWLGGVIVYE